jgi:hypothetical protein
MRLLTAAPRPSIDLNGVDCDWHFSIEAVPAASSQSSESYFRVRGCPAVAPVVQRSPSGRNSDRCAEYTVAYSALSAYSGHPLPDRYADLLDIAFSAHHVHKLIPRRYGHAAVAPPRATDSSPDRKLRVRVTVPVRDPAHWQTSAITNQIGALLSKLTGDVWLFEFATRAQFGRVTQLPLYPGETGPIINVPAPAAVCLFSGGLDALAGVATQLSSVGTLGKHLGNAPGPLVLVSIETNKVIAGVQANLVWDLRRRFPSVQLRHVSIPVQLSWRSDDPKERHSARTRGFLFLVAGSVASLLSGASALHVFENGVGAINLPYHRGQVGADQSRSVHPETLLAIQRLIRTALDDANHFTVVNPFLFLSKAQVCQNLRFHPLQDLVPHTISCDRFPRHASGPNHCGVCTSCVLRRVSLRAAGLVDLDDQTAYRSEILWLATRRGQQSRRALPVQLPLFSATAPCTTGALTSQPAGAEAATWATEHSDLSQDLVPTRAMDQQASLLAKCIEGSLGTLDAWNRLQRHFPDLAVVKWLTGVAETEASLVRLYECYLHEWRRFAGELHPAILGTPHASRRVA